MLLSPKGVSVKRGVRAGTGAGVGVGVYPVLKNIILGLGLVSTSYYFGNTKLVMENTV